MNPEIFKCTCNSNNELHYLQEYLFCIDCQKKFLYDKNNNIFYLLEENINDKLKKINEDWSNHWKDTNSLFYKLKKIMRRYMTGSILKKFIEPHIIINNNKKIFLEAGSGLSETSMRINFSDIIYISLDLSKKALENNCNDQIKVQGNLFKIPILNQVIDVIFNVGVHEHYTNIENEKIFSEYERVLKKNGRLVLIWPFYYGPLMILAKIINNIVTFLIKKNYEIWPNQINEIRNLEATEKILSKSGFKKISHSMSLYDIFSTIILVYEKKY